ncbi:chromosome partition protein Smc-like isoform X3 [Silurus meridionalis]|uniref:chromosome partition protein Smc-like isoform X3 n=1 Tax=Silurus meridionalis TaxID=175797 RepID=UPI001EE9F379|nr:chromosome partition protein Smc-like isoform X3 [Silurus meridionalis]
MITLIVLLLLLLLLVISGIIIYGCIIYMKMKRRMEEVKRSINQIESVNKHTLEEQREMKKLIVIAEEKINDLEVDYRENRILSARVKRFCSDCRSDLEIYKTLYLIDMFPVVTPIGQEEQMKMIKQIEQMKQEDKQKLKSRIKEVKRSIKQIESVNKDTPEGQEEMKNLIYNTQWKINNLEEDYRENRSLSARVKLYCTQHRSDLDTYQTIYEKNMSTEPYITEQMKTEEVLMKIERVVKILQMLKHGESKEEKNRVYQHVESELEEIRDWCSEQTEDLDPETQQGGEGDSKAMRKMNALINVFRNWCFETERELKKHKKINNDPTTTKLPLLPPERGTESSPDQVEVLDEGVALMSL